jgi:hypothetical protein
MGSMTVRRVRVIDPGYRSPNPQPEGFVCARVYIPDDTLHMAAFWNQVWQLTQWLTWQRGGTLAKDAAEVWKAAWELSRDAWEVAGGECGLMDVRQSETTPCILEKTSDGSEWESFANLALCAPRMRILDGVIQQEIETGVWENVSPLTQPVEDRLNGPVTPVWETVPPGEDGNCLAAANASAYVNTIVYEIANAFGAATEFAAILAIILGYLSASVTGVLGLVSLFLLEIAAWSISNWNDIRDYDTTSDLTGLLVCRFGPTGVMSQSDWNIALGDITAARNACGVDDDCLRRWFLVRAIVEILGPVGMSRLAGASGITTYDCSGITCYDWTHTFDFSESDNDWTAEISQDYPAGIYENSAWYAVYRGQLGSTGAYRIHVKSPVGTDSTVKQVFAWYEWEDAQSGAYQVTQSTLYRDTAEIYNPWSEVGYGQHYPDGDPKTSGVFTQTADQIRIWLDIIDGSLPQPPQGDVGSTRLTKVVLFGTGTDPWA